MDMEALGINCDMTVNGSVFPHFVWDRAILKNNWNEVVDLILKPRPGGNKLFSRSFSLLLRWSEKSLKRPIVSIVSYSGERIPGALQGRVGKDSGPGGGTEKASQQALCGRAVTERPVYVRQEKHRHCVWAGWFSVFAFTIPQI